MRANVSRLYLALLCWGTALWMLGFSAEWGSDRPSLEHWLYLAAAVYWSLVAGYHTIVWTRAVMTLDRREAGR